ncbi:hypothetical protein FACS189449_11270 [Alphaproteobacteria bacterium]|nr:hypothetical protein FACS189449_11270 [Alphaproteobacteria bacterium]
MCFINGRVVADGIQNLLKKSHQDANINVCSKGSVMKNVKKDVVEIINRNGRDDELYGILKFIPTGYKYYIYSATGIPEKIEGKF